jgi:hypothetical protein
MRTFEGTGRSGMEASATRAGLAQVHRPGGRPSLADAGPRPPYCAIFEFSQGASPRTVYECEPLPDGDRDAFRMAVVNTPTNMLSSWDSPPIVVRAFSHDLHYIAHFIQIQDVQARGFARAIVFVVASRCAPLVDCIACRHRERFQRITAKIQEHSKRLFPTELALYRRSLQNLIARSDGEARALLIAKLGELQRLVDASSIAVADPALRVVDDHPLEFFTQINNNLRGIEELLELERIAPAIGLFVRSLPTDEIAGNLVMSAWQYDGPIGLSTLRIFMGQADPLYLIGPLITSRKFQACLFALFSGRTMVLACEDKAAGVAFAERLSVISPLTQPYAICAKPVEELDYARFPIVIGQRINADFVSVLNLDDGTFEGPLCPADSFVMREFFQQAEVCEAWVFIAAANDAKRMFGRFRRKIAELMGRARQTQERFLCALERTGFARADEPIVRCWMDALTRPQERRVLLL